MNGTSFSEGAFSFARQLAKEQPTLLTGVFLPDTTKNSAWMQDEDSIYLFEPFMEQQREVMEDNLALFRHRCEENGLSFRIHTGYFDAVRPALQHESRFADILILSNEQFYDRLHERSGQSLLESVLSTSACPIIIVPEKFSYPKKNILLYDGSTSSVYAIKQFAYLFPSWCQKETSIVFMKHEENEELPGELAFNEWVNHHFSNTFFLKLHMDPRNHLASWAEEQQQSILVSGAFGRSSFSQFLRKSLLSDVIATHKLPVFIAHKTK